MKIKEYINSKPKLKKTLKILAVIGVIFSVGFNILIIGVASCSNNKSEPIEPLVTTPIKNVVNRNNGYFDIGITELGGEIFVTKFIDNIKGYEYVWGSNVTTENFLLGTPVTIDITSGTTLADLQYGYYADGDFYRDYYVTDIVLHYDNSLDYSTDFTFGFRANNVWRYILTRLNYSDSSKTQCISNVKYVIGGTVVDPYDVCLRFYKTDWQTIIPFDIFDINNYNLGYENGYNYGWQVGYNEGVHIETLDAFGVIGQAFGAVSNILNINVLPHLPLWVLIFSPLIVSIIIVVVKMIKG